VEVVRPISSKENWILHRTVCTHEFVVYSITRVMYLLGGELCYILQLYISVHF